MCVWNQNPDRDQKIGFLKPHEQISGKLEEREHISNEEGKSEETE